MVKTNFSTIQFYQTLKKYALSTCFKQCKKFEIMAWLYTMLVQPHQWIDPLRHACELRSHEKVNNYLIYESAFRDTNINRFSNMRKQPYAGEYCLVHVTRERWSPNQITCFRCIFGLLPFCFIDLSNCFILFQKVFELVSLRLLPLVTSR